MEEFANVPVHATPAQLAPRTSVTGSPSDYSDVKASVPGASNKLGE